jgi:hypothetical protein
MIEVAFKEWREGERASHHGLGRRQRRIGGVHVTQMNFAFVGDRGPAEQPLVHVEERDIEAARSQRESRATAL